MLRNGDLKVKECGVGSTTSPTLKLSGTVISSVNLYLFKMCYFHICLPDFSYINILVASDHTNRYTIPDKMLTICPC